VTCHTGVDPWRGGNTLTPNVATAFGHRQVDALGAMSIGYGGQGESLTYRTTATFQFAHPANTDFLFGFESQGSLGTGFDSAMLDVFVNSVVAYQRSFTTLADAQAFFTDNPVDIGFGPGGPATIELVYDLTGSQNSGGFQFDYAFGSASAVPGPVAGAGLPGMMLAGGGFLAWRRRRKQWGPSTGNLLASGRIETDEQDDSGAAMCHPIQLGSGKGRHIRCLWNLPI
jgi:LPXTG-motif cell wall-anchored protein